MRPRNWATSAASALLLVLSGAAACCAAPAAKPPIASPKLVAERTVYDAGRVRAGAVVRIDFPIRNDGRAPLRILRVKQECGCTEVDWDDVIDPGKTGHLRVALRTNEFVGAVEKHVYLQSDDPKAARVVFVIKAVVPLAVEATPSADVVIPIEGGQAATAEVTLRSTDETTLHVNALESKAPYLLAEIAPGSAEVAREVKLRLTVTAAAPPEGFQTEVAVSTGHPLLHWLAIRVFGQPSNAVTVRPPRLTFPVMRPDEKGPIERLLTLTRRNGGFHVLKVEDPQNRLRAQVVPGADSSYCEIRLTYPGGWIFPPVQGVLRITTDDATRRVVEVPYSVGILVAP